MAGPKYTKEQKERFFDLLDRGGTVRAAAAAAGVHPAAIQHRDGHGRLLLRPRLSMAARHQ